MVNLRQLGVTYGLLVARDRGGRVEDHVKVEERADQTLSGAEGGEDNGRMERLRGEEVLDGKVLLRL